MVLVSNSFEATKEAQERGLRCLTVQQFGE